MLLLSRIILAMILAIVVQNVDGSQRIVHVSELVSDDEGFFASGEVGDSSDLCCVYGNCSCNSLNHALANLTSNVLINITTDVMLSSIIKMSNLQNVSIIGHNNPTVNCKAGGVHLTYCHNCIIQGITWNGCGSISKAGLTLNYPFNITIQNCSFHNSSRRAVLLSEGSGHMNINYCNFVNNNRYTYHGSAIHYSSNANAADTSHSVLHISNCNFTHNKRAKSLVYVEEKSIQHCNISLYDSIFHDNKGVSIFLVNQKLHLNGNISFHNNVAKSGTGIHISDHSTVVFSENSDVAFIQNSANYSGGAVFLENNSSILFDHNATVKFSSNSATKRGAAICSRGSSHIIFKGKSNVTFNNNTADYGGAVYSSYNDYISFEGNSTTVFSNNAAHNKGGAIRSYYHTHIAFRRNSTTVFTNNIAASYGAALSARDHSHTTFDDSSTVIFSDNEAENGTVYSETRSNVTFKATCEVTFSGNSAKQYGAAVHSFDKSHVIFTGNARVTFNNNIASSSNQKQQLGGTIRSENNGYISFEENSTTVFSNNIGAAVYLKYKSNMKFKDRSRAKFNDNTAKRGGAIALYDNCTVTIEQLSNLTFSNNVASQCGGALHFSHHCHFSFKDNSFVSFADNRAQRFGGAVCFKRRSSIKFEENSAAIFKNNTASFGENLYSTSNSVTVTRNSNVKINNKRWSYGGQLTNTIKMNDIAIDANGLVRCIDHKEYYVCQYKTCFCKNIKDIPSNVVVIITDNMILSSTTQLTDLVNITLIGYNNSSIHCVNDGGLQFISCSNVTITNIIWNTFINNKRSMSNNIPPQIKFHNSSSITIDNCTFQQSVGQAVVLSEVSGDVNVNHCKFVNNMYLHGVHGAAMHYSSNCTKFCEDRLVISDTNFTDNVGMASLIFLENINNNTCSEYIILRNSKFHNNGGVCIYLSNQNLYIKGNITFENNAAENGTGIFINHHSNVIFSNASNVTFAHNTADISGGAIYVNNWSTVVFENILHVMFFSNKATKSGGAISLYNNSHIICNENSAVQFEYSTSELGGSLYADKSSFIITRGRSELIINNNEALYGGAIYLQSSFMAITENSKITFHSNEAKEDGGCIYSDSNSSIMFSGKSITKSYNSKATQGGAIYSCNNSSTILDEDSMVWFNHSTAEFGGTSYLAKSSFIITKGKSALTVSSSEAINGGAIYFTHTSTMTVMESSTIALLDNEAKADGGSIYSDSNSSIMFKGNSKTTITDNKGRQGGAIYSTSKSNVEFDNNVTVIFNRNEAVQNGGCIYTENSNIQFKGSRRVMFKDSVVFNGAGGAIFCTDNSKISFISSKVTFHKNTVYNGEGGAICCTNSVVTFEGTSDVEFNNNKAIDGGAAIFNLNSSLIIRSTTFVSFNNNSATMGGAVNFYGNSNGIFEMNSTLVLRGNDALQNGGAFHLESESTIEFTTFAEAQFDKNKAILGGAVYCSKNSYIILANLSNVSLTENNAERGGAVFLTASKTSFMNYSNITFKNNTASQDGGAIYIADQSHLMFQRSSNVIFSHNSASDYGGAIYGEMVKSRVNFDYINIAYQDNNAGTAGSSVYINLPKQCDSACLTDSVLGINTIDLQYNKYIITSSNKIRLYNSNVQCIDFVNGTGCNLYYINNIMLGQKIILDVCMYDYYDHPIDVARFLISGTKNQGYNLDSNNTLITCNRTLELVSIYGNESAPFNYSINLSLYDSRKSESKEVLTNLLVELSPCHPGFSYHKMSQKCECYNATDIVVCSGSSSTIKRGYWFGDVTGKSTVTSCPINYCNFTCCESSSGYYHLSLVRDNQCRPHRSGAACGSCTHGYTLSFDSAECVNVESCTAGQTVLVIFLTVMYWIVMVTLVFAMMYYKVGIGYLYGITYYYSIVDILLSQNLYASGSLYLTVTVMSSFSKITPQFLGELCLTTGMSGIDQQFIHYIHPSAVMLILGIITLLARMSQRVSAIISRGIIHVICLLLLLSYTSVASTSLLLMRPLTFHEIDEVYSYLSPDIEYFHGRHLAYGIVALLCTVTIVIGLPLLLTLEPFLNHKFNFIRIKPLLDQFQGCYKDKYRYFAGYYMICRLVIISIVIADLSHQIFVSYMLIIVCGIMTLIHLLVKPYNGEVLNKLDGIVLQLIIFITALPLFNDFDSPLVITIVFVLVIMPLMNFIAVTVFLYRHNFKKIVAHFTLKGESLSSNDLKSNEISVMEFGLVVDDSMRENATICTIDQDDDQSNSNCYRESFFEVLNNIQD